MDDVANLEDQADYSRNADIKTKLVQDTLKSFINLKDRAIRYVEYSLCFRKSFQ